MPTATHQSKPRRRRRRTAHDYVPDGTVHVVDCEAEASAERRCCPVCDKTFAGGAIVNSEPLFCQVEQSWSIVRRLYCDHCDHIVIWTESANAAGEPRGLQLNEPGLVRARSSVANFLRHHPEATGVLQS
jgi:hypothetical protein